MSTLAIPPAPLILLTDTSDSDSGNEAEEFHIDADISAKYEQNHIEIAKKIFIILLDDWMYGYGDIYTPYHYMPLFSRIIELVSEEKIIDFLLPGFPVKSPNIIKKVLGSHADFAEFIALKSFLTTARKIQQIYKKGISITILSDYHTFDQYIGVTEEAYTIYHAELKEIIFNMGGDDVIKLISLASFPEFQDTITTQLSRRLSQQYGCSEFLEKFDQNVREDSDLLEKYRQMLKFMQTDQETRLPGSPRSRKTRLFLKEIATGMMSQGLALDAFLKEQRHLNDYVRISIHHHHPKKGKFAVDLLKQYTVRDGILRTPWHHSVLFDTINEEFVVAHKDTLMENDVENSIICTVMRRKKEWFLIKIVLDASKKAVLGEKDISINTIKDGCGLIIENVTTNCDLKADIFDVSSIRSMIKHFGVVVLRGFARFKNGEDLFNSYLSHGENGIVRWKSGSVHVVKPSKDIPGYVNKNEGIPIHWDLVLPPRYMGISQSSFKYEDFTCREFLLYCQQNSATGSAGATTFVDACGVVLALRGELTEKGKNTTIVCESRLLQNEMKMEQNENSKKNTTLYFGGQGNTFEYPLIQRCLWTDKEVLRWVERWTEADHPGTVQEQTYKLKSKIPNHDDDISINDLEDKIVEMAFDERFYFGHTYEEGDQVYVNNYTMLHGRNSFTNERELWRVQLIPSSDNLPEYFKTHGHTFYAYEH